MESSAGLLCTRKKKSRSLICPPLLPGHTTCISKLPAGGGPGVLVSCVLLGGWQASCTIYPASLPHREAPSTHKTSGLEQRELHLLLSLDRGVSSGQNPLTGVSRLTNLRKPTARREGAPCHPGSLRSSARGCCPEPSSTHLAQAARQPLRGARPLAPLLAHASAAQLRPPSRSPPL